MIEADLSVFNPFTPEFHADPYPSYQRLRELGPIAHTPYGIWLAVRHEEIASIVRDPRFGHGEHDDLARARMQQGDDPGLRLDLKLQSFLTMDPPDHTRLRGAVRRAFTPRYVAALEPRIRQVAEDLLDKVPADAGFDLMADFAYPLPLTVVGELLGIPAEDEERLRGWSQALARGTEPQIMLSEDVVRGFDDAGDEFVQYLYQLIARRRDDPGDDILSGLIAASSAGELTMDEVITTCMLLLIAGHETTASMIGNAVLALTRNPDQLVMAAGAGPLLPATAADELLRYDSSVQITRRVALEDVDVCGQKIPQGDSIVLLLGSGNRDPEVFEEPDRLDLTRENAAQHLAFSAGIHFCLGAALARLELQVGLAVLLSRAPALRITAEPTWRQTLMLRGPDVLPVKLGRVPAAS